MDQSDLEFMGVSQLWTNQMEDLDYEPTNQDEDDFHLLDKSYIFLSTKNKFYDFLVNLKHFWEMKQFNSGFKYLSTSTTVFWLFYLAYNKC